MMYEFSYDSLIFKCLSSDLSVLFSDLKLEYRYKYLHWRQNVWEVVSTVFLPLSTQADYHLLKMEIWVELDLKRHQALAAQRASLCKLRLLPFGKSVLSLATWNKTSCFDPEFWNLKMDALSTLCHILFDELTDCFGTCGFFRESR